MKKLFLAALFSVLAGVLSLPAQATTIKNFEEVYRQPCDFVSGAFYGDDWCNVGNAQGKAPNVVLIGDSYSNSLDGMMEAYAQADKDLIYEQYGRGQCPTLLGYGPGWCSSFAQAVYARVKKTPSIKTVMLATQWHYYWAEKKWYGQAERPYTRDEFKKSFAQTIKAYQALGKRVVVVYQTPSIDDPKLCASRRFSFFSTSEQCHLSRSDADRNEEYRSFLTPFLAQEKVASLDPFVYFCDAKTCKLHDGDKVFNTTSTHLSGFGGQYLAQKAAPDLKKLLGY